MSENWVFATAARKEVRDTCDAACVAFIRANGWSTSAQIAEATGVPRKRATKRLMAMRHRGLVVRLGISFSDSVWALADDQAAQKLAAQQRVAPRVRQPSRAEMPDTFRQVIVPAKRRRLPSNLGPSSVFDLGAMA